MKLNDDLESRLRAWGRVLGEHGDGPDEIPDADKTRNHALVRAAQFPPGAVSNRAARSMASLRGSPAWGFDPVVCTETRTHRISTPDDLPPDVQRVQRAFERLHEYAPRLANVLLIQYHRRGTQFDKAEDLGLPYRRYKEQLSGARAGMLLILSDM